MSSVLPIHSEDRQVHRACQRRTERTTSLREHVNNETSGRPNWRFSTIQIKVFALNVWTNIIRTPADGDMRRSLRPDSAVNNIVHTDRPVTPTAIDNICEQPVPLS